tara:strand:- start:16 stop:1548 length:1533 start_codon:yes stop_codon:yes gene_type:complete
MATGTLTSTTIASTYKSLLKVKGGANQVLESGSTAHYLEDGDGNDSVLALSQAFVGIGTEAPLALLSVGAITTLVTDGTTAVTPEGMNVHITEASKYAMGIKNADASGDGLIIQAGDAADDFALRVEDYDSANDLLVVRGDGYVGIGITAPSDDATYLALDIASDNSSAVGNTLRITDSDTSMADDQQIGAIEFFSADGGASGAGVVSKIWSQSNSTNPGADLKFDTDGTTRMVIATSAGYVGIGADPTSPLHVLNTGTNTVARIAGGSSTSTFDLQIVGTNSPSNYSVALKSTEAASAGMAFYTRESGGGITEKMVINGSGGVGVGVSDPDEKLECNGAFHVSGPRVAGAQAGLYLSAENSAGQANIIANGADGSTVGTMLFIVREADAGNAITAMSVATTGVIDGDFEDTSDEALKTNIIAIPAGLSIVNALNPVTFDWDSDVTRRSGSKSGFIAQEVETVLPNDVSGDDYDADDAASGKSINVTGIVAHLTKAVQELSAKVEALENA